MSLPKLCFVGLGVMGLPMARHLAAAGYAVNVFDLDASRGEVLAGEFEAVKAVSSPAEGAADADIVITMLPNGSVVNAAVTGQDGIASTIRSGSLLLDTSSSEPWLTEQTAATLAEKGVAMVDAPVSGAEAGAIAGELVFMVGGAADDVARVTPLLEIMGSHNFHLGPLAAGHRMKSLNNLITSVTFMATAEGLLAGKRAGLDPHKMIDVMNLSTGGSWVGRTHFQQRIFNRAFDDPFKLGLMVKDIGIALQVAEESGLEMPLSELTGRLWREIEATEGAGSSVSRLVAGMEKRAGTELTPGSSKES